MKKIEGNVRVERRGEEMFKYECRDRRLLLSE